MKKKNSKKNRGALKRCFFGAGIFSLFFTCRTAAMEIGGFDVEIGVGENTDYPPDWNEIPGNSEAVLPEETPSIGERNGNRGQNGMQTLISSQKILACGRTRPGVRTVLRRQIHIYRSTRIFSGTAAKVIREVQTMCFLFHLHCLPLFPLQVP